MAFPQIWYQYAYSHEQDIYTPLIFMSFRLILTCVKSNIEYLLWYLNLAI